MATLKTWTYIVELFQCIVSTAEFLHVIPFVTQLDVIIAKTGFTPSFTKLEYIALVWVRGKNDTGQVLKINI